MNIIFAKFDWTNFYQVNDVNIALNIIYELVLDTNDKTVPKTLIQTQKFFYLVLI